MKRKFGVEINLPKGAEFVNIPVSDEVKEYLQKEIFKRHKNYLDYLKEFLITENNWNIVNDALDKAMDEALPPTVKENCLYCKGESDKANDKACAMYYVQMQMTFCMAGNEFVSLILNHKHIYQNKRELLNVTQEFYKSFVLVKGAGVMYFDLDKICKCILHAGFRSLSKIFASSDALKNLTIINEHIDYFEDKRLENELLNKADEDYIDLQQRFFENKQRFYKEKLLLEEKGLNKLEKPKPKKLIIKEKTIPVIALYYYYLQAAGDFPHFENHPEGKLKAIDELIENDNIETTAKYFQIQYNLINNYKSNRIAKRQASNIEIVANQLLNDYPNAQKIALAELKEARTKNR